MSKPQRTESGNWRMTGHLEKDAWRPTPGVQIQPGKALWASIGTRVNGRAVRKGDLRTVDGAKQGSLPLCYLKSSPGLDVCCFNDVAISCSLWARVLHCCSRGVFNTPPQMRVPGVQSPEQWLPRAEQCRYRSRTTQGARDRKGRHARFASIRPPKDNCPRARTLGRGCTWVLARSTIL